MDTMVGIPSSADIAKMVPGVPSELGLTLDGDMWRPGQTYLIAHALEAFLIKGRKFWLLNGATGSGKSVVAAAIGRILGGRSLFLTHTKQLQAQYLKTLNGAMTVTGKNNHRCLRSPFKGATAEDCDDCLYVLPSDDKWCSYQSQLLAASVSDEIVLNYAYATRILRTNHINALHGGTECPGCNPFRQRDLLVCDEGDLTENAVVSTAGVEIYRRSYDAEMGYPLPSSTLVRDWTEWATTVLPSLTNKLVGAVAAQEASPSEEGLSRIRRLRGLTSSVKQIKGMDAEDTDRVVSQDRSSVTIRPLWGWADSFPLLFRHIERVILMSATLGDPKVLTKKLGIAAEDYVYISSDSPFPVENRPIYRWPVVKVSARTPDDEMLRLVSAADYVIQNYPDKKGIIHTASHKLANYFAEHSEHKERLTTHGTRDRIAALESFRDSPEARVLVTASFTTGLDLPGIIGFQVILKVAFGNLADNVTRWRKEWGSDGDRFGSKNYAAEAMNTVVQAVGRGVRTEEDVCHTYILDGNFNHLVRSAYSPKSFRDALQWLEKGG